MYRGGAVVLPPGQRLECGELVEEFSRDPVVDNLTWALSHYGALRVSEIAHLRLDSIYDPVGNVRNHIRIAPHTTKGSRGRTIPMAPMIKRRFLEFLDVYPDAEWVARSPRNGRQMNPAALQARMDRRYRDIGFVGCSSHTGRATCITELARMANYYRGTLRDVQIFAGHKRLETTASYLAADGAIVDMVSAYGANHQRGRRNHYYEEYSRNVAEPRIDEHQTWARQFFGPPELRRDGEEARTGEAIGYGALSGGRPPRRQYRKRPRGYRGER